MYRELAPVFRDMLKDFHVKLTFEAYAPLIPNFFSGGGGSPPFAMRAPGQPLPIC